jgi:CheY-like chemotaxis protein
VALTANAMSHQVEEYLAAGMDGHVAKPIEIAKLYEAISAALNAAATGGETHAIEAA